MKACNKCGANNPNTSNFCDSCGTALTDNTTDTQHSTKTNIGFNPATYSSADSRYKPSKANTHGYGDTSVSFLLLTITVISVVIVIAAGIGGLIAGIAAESFGLVIIVWIAGGLTAGIFYLLASCLIHIYSNIAIIARNSDAQTALMQQAQNDAANRR